LKYQMLQFDSVKHELIKMILEHYGEESQRIKACEELVELQAEIFHNSSIDVLEGRHAGGDSSDTYDKVVSEIADVYIMLEQVVRMYKIDPEDIRAAMVKKLRRTEDNIIYDKTGTLRAGTVRKASADCVLSAELFKGGLWHDNKL